MHELQHVMTILIKQNKLRNSSDNIQYAQRVYNVPNMFIQYLFINEKYIAKKNNLANSYNSLQIKLLQINIVKALTNIELNYSK